MSEGVVEKCLVGLDAGGPSQWRRAEPRPKRRARYRGGEVGLVMGWWSDSSASEEDKGDESER